MKALIVIALGIVLAVQAAAQTTATSPQPSVTRDPQALSLLGQSLAAMVKGLPIQDVRLQAQVTRTAGSTTDTGAATLEASGYDKSNTNLGFTSGPDSDIRNGNAGVWSGVDAKSHPVPMHNTWTAAAWFAPALVIQSWVQDPSFCLAYAGQERRDGAQVHHVRAWRTVTADPRIASLSAMDLYLDPQTLLPVALGFNTHPDDDLGIDLPVQVTFANYQTFSGLAAPARIQQFLQGSLLLDLSVNATSANNGLGAGDFQLP